MGEKHPLYWLDEDGVPHEVDSDAQGLIDKAEARSQAAEARVEGLSTALQQIADLDGEYGESTEAGQIASAALAGGKDG